MTNKIGRILALDYGKRRIGVAISDALGITAQPLETWVGADIKKVICNIQQLIEDQGVVEVLVGMPLNLKGEQGEIAEKVLEFTQSLRNNLDVEINLWDERLTSKLAERTMQQMGMKPSRKKEKIDQLASVILLQNYLDFKESNGLKHYGDCI